MAETEEQLLRQFIKDYIKCYIDGQELPSTELYEGELKIRMEESVQYLHSLTIPIEQNSEEILELERDDFTNFQQQEFLEVEIKQEEQGEKACLEMDCFGLLQKEEKICWNNIDEEDREESDLESGQEGVASDILKQEGNSLLDNQFILTKKERRILLAVMQKTFGQFNQRKMVYLFCLKDELYGNGGIRMNIKYMKGRRVQDVGFSFYVKFSEDFFVDANRRWVNARKKVKMKFGEGWEGGG